VPAVMLSAPGAKIVMTVMKFARAAMTVNEIVENDQAGNANGVKGICGRR